eukprot:549018-Prymnesium_polylepis.1
MAESCWCLKHRRQTRRWAELLEPRLLELPDAQACDPSAGQITLSIGNSVPTSHPTEANGAISTPAVEEIVQSATTPADYALDLLIFACCPSTETTYANMPDELHELTRRCQGAIYPCCNTDLLRRGLKEHQPRWALVCGHTVQRSSDDPGPSDLALRRTVRKLGFTESDAQLAPINPIRMANAMGNSVPTVELVFLDGGKSVALGRQISEKGIPFVVCWRTDVHDDAARSFAVAFFTTLMRLQSRPADLCSAYHTSFESGKLALKDASDVSVPAYPHLP